MPIRAPFCPVSYEEGKPLPREQMPGPAGPAPSRLPVTLPPASERLMSSASPAPILVFDLDGTLVDTAPDLVATLNIILTRDGFEPVPYDDARTMIGGGAKAMLERALRKRDGSVTAADLDRMFSAFIEHYAAHIADDSRPFRGAEAALDQLADDGFIFAVCTNKLEWLSRRLLDALDLTKRFAFICGQDTFSVKKPDPEVLRLTVARSGGDIATAVMVGDSATDIDTARAAGIPVIAVDFGYTEIPVSELKPDAIISRFEALPAAITTLRRKS
jgi:phosphoglycolate phosphatase